MRLEKMEQFGKAGTHTGWWTPKRKAFLSEFYLQISYQLWEFFAEINLQMILWGFANLCWSGKVREE